MSSLQNQEDDRNLKNSEEPPPPPPQQQQQQTTGATEGEEGEEEEEEPHYNQQVDESSRADEQSHQSNQSHQNLHSVKKFFVFKNGTSQESPRSFTYNNRQIRTWDVFLEYLTEALKPRTGPIREIKTPHGKRKINNFDELEALGKYVAVPRGEPFRTIDYANLPVTRPAANRRSYANSLKKSTMEEDQIKPVIHSRIKANSRILNEFDKKSIYFFVYKNGDFYQRAIGVLLKPIEQANINRVYASIENRVILPQSRPIRKLYRMDGYQILYPTEINDQEFYVVGGNEPFCPGDYGHALPPVHTGKVEHPFSEIRSLRHLPTPPEQVNRRSQNSSNNKTSSVKKEKKTLNSENDNNNRNFNNRNDQQTGATEKAQTNNQNPNENNPAENKPVNNNNNNTNQKMNEERPKSAPGRSPDKNQNDTANK